MLFFSGFGFKNEKILFKEYLDFTEFSIAGFSYGAQKALLEALQRVRAKKRLQKLQLLSPAFFNDMPKAIKQKELQNFAKNPELYMRFFYKKAAYPYKGDITPFKSPPTLGELKELLFFEWKEEDLRELVQEGVQIEVYLGSMDKIINSERAKAFFQPFATIYFIKEVGHLLR